MTHSLVSTELRESRGGYLVRKPRPADAVGGSLLDIYDAQPGLPPEFTMLLRRLDAVGR